MIRVKGCGYTPNGLGNGSLFRAHPSRVPAMFVDHQLKEALAS